MNGKSNHADRQPTPAELVAWADGELAPNEAGRVERWLAEHPDAAQEADASRQLVRLYREHPAPDPGELAWQSVLGGIEAALAARPAARSVWRFRLLAGLLATAALVAGVVMARALWPTRPVGTGGLVDVRPAGPVEDEEPFPVARASDVHIIRMDPKDADRVVMGVPLMGTFELVSTEEVEIVEVERDPDEGWVPRVQRSAGGPMIIVAHADEDDEP